jgi:hypothetical protein
VSKHGADLGRGQIGGQSFDAHVLPPENLPEPFQGFSAFALADIDYSTASQVKHDGQVAVSFADSDFIDGNAL